jgi:flavin-dependent dehydrogenase
MIVRDLERNALQSHSASWILLADGKRALIGARPRPTGDLGVKAHFEHLSGPGDAIELFGVDGHYGGVAPIEDGRWNVAFSVPAQRVRAAGGDLDMLFAHIVQENRALRDRFLHARRTGDWLTSPLPRFAVAKDWPRRIIPLGNAAASIEPVGGEGMGLAMRSAELASEMLLSGEMNLAGLRRDFARLWRTRRYGCRAAGWMVSQPGVARWIAPLAEFKPLKRAAMAMLGKSHLSLSAAGRRLG